MQGGPSMDHWYHAARRLADCDPGQWWRQALSTIKSQACTLLYQSGVFIIIFQNLTFSVHHKELLPSPRLVNSNEGSIALDVTKGLHCRCMDAREKRVHGQTEEQTNREESPLACPLRDLVGRAQSTLPTVLVCTHHVLMLPLPFKRVTFATASRHARCAPDGFS